MQTFLPYPSFSFSAVTLDYRRLGKQRVEGYQILKTLAIGPKRCCFCKQGPEICCCLRDDCHLVYTPWYNHPAVRMWRGYESHLYQYTLSMCAEWAMRGFEDNMTAKLVQVKPPDSLAFPPWLGNEEFHSSHRAALLYKNYAYYNQFNWNENPKLSYFWPV